MQEKKERLSGVFWGEYPLFLLFNFDLNFFMFFLSFPVRDGGSRRQ